MLEGVTTEPPRPPLDVVLPHAPTEDGGGVKVVRLKEREHTVDVELGEVRGLVEGRPIQPSTEVVRLKPRADGQALDVEVVLPRQMQPGEAPHKGPAQIATDAYRRNWEAIFCDEPDGERDDELS
jgi:hypothetical protein